MTFGPESILGDRYQLERRIAGGGMGEVWAARDVVLERQVAVKVLRAEFADDATFRQRFLAEARHAALLSHPGIAGVFDFGEAEGTPYIVMELVEGETLASLLAREGRLPVGQTLSVVGQAALALQAAHEAGVVHRDVKPGNLIVRPDGVVKVTDFGIARAMAGASMTMTGNVLGTVHYIAPEQARGERVTPASDTYALGVVAWECLAGARPFPFDSQLAIATAHANEPLPALPADVPERVRALVGHATEKDPARRPASVGEFGREAMALAAGFAGDADPVPVRPLDAAATAPMRAISDARETVPAAAPVPAPPVRARERTMMLPPVLPAAPVPAAPLPTVVPREQRRSRGWIPLLVALLVAGAIVGVALLVKPASNTSKPKPTVTATTSRAPRTSSAAATTAAATTPARITLNPADYVDKQFGEVQQALTTLGLVADRQDRPDSSVAGTVLEIGNGPYSQGEHVSVIVSSGPPTTTDATTTDGPGGGGQPGETGPNPKGKAYGHDKKGKD